MKTKVLVLMVALVATGCSKKGFYREEMNAEFGQELQVTDASVQEELARRAQLPKPFRLGVYFRDPEMRGIDAGFSRRWSEEERERIFSVLEGFRGQQISHVVNVLPIQEKDQYGQIDQSLPAIRRSAARFGVDAVLVISGVGETVRNANAAALTYLLLAPMFFVRGTNVDSLFIVRATLWDVRNEFLYAAAETEAQTARARPMADAEEKEILLESRKKAVDGLAVELGRQLNGWTGTGIAAQLP